MGRLIEMGILNEYLQENCDEKDFLLCEYKDQIIWGFLWGEESPLYKDGGWTGEHKEYKLILSDIFTTPKYLKKFLIHSFESSFKQFFNFETGDTPRLVDKTPPYIITDYIAGQKMEYLSSKQANNRLDYSYLNNIEKYIVILSLFLCFILFLIKIPRETKANIFFILIALYLNAAIFGAFSGITSRYQSRVMWLLPLPVILALMNKEIRNNLFMWK